MLVDESGEPGDEDEEELESDGLDVESLLAQAQGLPPLLDLPPDADDETMVELAIALSLQVGPRAEEGIRGCSVHERRGRRLDSVRDIVRPLNVGWSQHIPVISDIRSPYSLLPVRCA